MGISAEYRTYLEDLFDPVGGVSQRRMFGGLGLFRDGLMFGLVDDEVLYLKADDQTIPDFQAEGCGPFTYRAKGKPRALNYWRAPDRLFDDADALRSWALAAFEVALRAKR